MKKQDYGIALSALIMAFMGFYPCRRSIFLVAAAGRAMIL